MTRPPARAVRRLPLSGLLLAALVPALALGLAGCGSSDDAQRSDAAHTLAYDSQLPTRLDLPASSTLDQACAEKALLSSGLSLSALRSLEKNEAVSLLGAAPDVLGGGVSLGGLGTSNGGGSVPALNATDQRALAKAVATIKSSCSG